MFASRRSVDAHDAYGPGGDVPDHLAAGHDDDVRHMPRSPRQAIEPETVPEPGFEMAQKRSPLFVFFNGILSFVVFVIVAAGVAFLVAKQQFEAPGPLAQTRSVIIPQGEGLTQIATRLEREGVISDASLFSAGAYISKASGDLKAGEYLFREKSSMRDVMDVLVEGKAILHKITIPEGLTSEQIVARLREHEALAGEIKEVPAEGTLLPDTYVFTRGTDRSAIIARMRSAHDKALARIWERRSKDLPVKTPEELVILASIVEKETGKADERPRVAGVFVNRMNRSMRLQSDPTIIYGLVGGQGSLGRPILRSELDKPTEYNTYHIDGLPPTPIANPGVEAMEATANPSRTDDLYFVADGTGGHIFAATLAEHNQNVAKWRKIAADARAEAERRKEEEETAESETTASADDKPGEVPVPPLRIELKPLGN